MGSVFEGRLPFDRVYFFFCRTGAGADQEFHIFTGNNAPSQVIYLVVRIYKEEAPKSPDIRPSSPAKWPIDRPQSPTDYVDFHIMFVMPSSVLFRVRGVAESGDEQWTGFPSFTTRHNRMLHLRSGH